MRKAALAVAAAILAGAGMAQAATVITFDDLPVGAFVQSVAYPGAKFNGAAVVLANGIDLAPAFPPYSGDKVIYDYPYPVGIDPGIIRVDAVGPLWSMAGGYVTGNAAITLTAYDAKNNVLGSDSTPGPNYYDTDHPADYPPNIFLSVAVPNIAYVTFHDHGNTFTVDNFTYQAVPVPAAAWAGALLLGGLGAIKLIRRQSIA